MRFIHRFVAAAVVLVLAAGTAWAAQNETERVHKTFPLAPGGTLKLETFSGHVVITGTDAAEVVIDAVRRAPRDRLQRVKLDIQASGSSIRVEANRRDGWFFWGSNVVDTDFDIKVPRRTDVDVSAFSSAVRVSGVDGSHRVHSFSGDVRLEDVTGRVKADTFSGGVQVQLAQTGVRPELDLHTFSGNVDVRMPESAQASVEFNSFSGDLNSDLPLVLKSKNKHSLRGEIGAAGASNDVRVKTFSGDVHLRK